MKKHNLVKRVLAIALCMLTAINVIGPSPLCFSRISSAENKAYAAGGGFDTLPVTDNLDLWLKPGNIYLDPTQEGARVQTWFDSSADLNPTRDYENPAGWSNDMGSWDSTGGTSTEPMKQKRRPYFKYPTDMASNVYDPNVKGLNGYPVVSFEGEHHLGTPANARYIANKNMTAYFVGKLPGSPTKASYTNIFFTTSNQTGTFKRESLAFRYRQDTGGAPGIECLRSTSTANGGPFYRTIVTGGERENFDYNKYSIFIIKQFEDENGVSKLRVYLDDLNHYFTIDEPPHGSTDAEFASVLRMFKGYSLGGSHHETFSSKSYLELAELAVYFDAHGETEMEQVYDHLKEKYFNPDNSLTNAAVSVTVGGLSEIRIPSGTSAAYQYEVTQILNAQGDPLELNDKEVEWSTVPETRGISIDQNGLLTITNEASPGAAFAVRAKVDAVFGTFPVTVDYPDKITAMPTANMDLWLKSDSGLVFDITDEGKKVSGWNDASAGFAKPWGNPAGWSNNLIVYDSPGNRTNLSTKEQNRVRMPTLKFPTSNDKNVYDGAGLNGYPVIKFDGSSHMGTFSNQRTITSQGYTAYFVGKIPGTINKAAKTAIFFAPSHAYGTFANESFALRTLQDAGAAPAIEYYRSGTSSALAVTAKEREEIGDYDKYGIIIIRQWVDNDGKSKVSTYVHELGNRFVIEEPAPTAGGTQSRSFKGYSLGASNSASSSKAEMELAEVAVYLNSHNEKEMGLIYDYLKEKYFNADNKAVIAANVSINGPSSVMIPDVGESTIQYEARIFDNSGAALSGKQPVWELIYDGEVPPAGVTFDGNGKLRITSKANPGTRIQLKSTVECASSQVNVLLDYTPTEDGEKRLIDTINSNNPTQIKSMLEDSDFRKLLVAAGMNIDGYAQMDDEVKDDVINIIIKTSKNKAFTASNVGSSFGACLAVAAINAKDPDEVMKAVKATAVITNADVGVNSVYRLLEEPEKKEVKARVDAEILAAMPFETAQELVDTVANASMLNAFRNARWSEYGELILRSNYLIGFSSYSAYCNLTPENRQKVQRTMNVSGDAGYSDIRNAFETAYKSVVDSIGSSGGNGGGNGAEGGSPSKKTTNISISQVPGDGSVADIPNVQATEVFADLAQTEWAKPHILALVEKGVIDAAQDRFRPEDNVTRAEFLKMLTIALGINDSGEEVSFTDVGKGDWHYTFIASAYNAGIVKGFPDGSFGVEQPITRQDTSVMVARACGHVNIILPPVVDSADFADRESISEYALENVSALQRSGIVGGVGNNIFAPKNLLTRAEAAKIINSVINL